MLHTLRAAPRSAAIVLAFAGLALPLGCAPSGSVNGDSGASVSTPATPAPAPAAVAYGAAARTVAVIDGKEVEPPDVPMGDPAVLAAIVKEGRDRSKVMEHLTYLCTEIGPRLTGSTATKRANDWTMGQYTKWGLSNPRLEQWGTIGVGFDRGPCTGKIFMPDAPRPREGAPADSREWRSVRDLQFTTLSWTSGTKGPVRGPVHWMPKTEEEYQSIKSKLKGAWILIEPPPPVGGRGIRDRTSTGFEQRRDARKKVAEGTDPATLPIPQRVMFDGIAGYISTSRDERVWTGGVGGWRNLTMDTVSPEVQVVIRLSDYDYINSRLADNEDFQIEFDLKHTFNPGPVPTYNTIADIPGTEKPEEMVIISAHMDSWDGPGSRGTTDNGTGTSVVLEAARILAAVGAKPKRTIRFINYTGEEQGLLGSAGYVKDHKSELERISACFVDDGGTNYEGGLTVPPQMVPYLAKATAPVNNQFYCPVDRKFLNVDIKTSKRKSLGRGGASDHASFNAAGVPGFFWDEVGRADYGFGWHTQNDKLDLAVPIYLAQSATNMAVVAYNLACAPDLLPRSITEPSTGDERPERPERRPDPSLRSQPQN